MGEHWNDAVAHHDDAAGTDRAEHRAARMNLLERSSETHQPVHGARDRNGGGLHALVERASRHVLCDYQCLSGEVDAPRQLLRVCVVEHVVHPREVWVLPSNQRHQGSRAGNRQAADHDLTSRLLVSRDPGNALAGFGERLLKTEAPEEGRWVVHAEGEPIASGSKVRTAR